MNEQSIPTSPVAPEAINQVPNQISNLKNLFGKLRPVLIEYWRRFYSNKKIFYPVIGAFSLIFLVVILGLIFGNKNRSITTIKNTPTPQSSVSPEVTPGETTIGGILNELNSLKIKINSLDVNQRPLQPPNINFDIKF